MANLPRGIMEQVEEAIRANAGANVTLLDAWGHYVYLAEAIKSLFGYTEEDRQKALGKHFTLFVRPSEVDHLELAFQDALLNDESVLAPRDIRVKSGGYLRMSGCARKIVDEQSGEIYVLTIGRPVEQR